MHCVISALPLAPAPAHTPPCPALQSMEQSCVSNPFQSSGLWLCMCVSVCVHCTHELEWNLPAHHAAFPEQLSTLSPPPAQNPPAVEVCAPLGSVLSDQGSNPACWQCSDPQILITSLNLLFFIFSPPSHTMPLSCCPRNCLHLAVCSDTEGGLPPDACGYQKAQWRTRLMGVSCELCMFSCTWESLVNVWKKDVLSA